MSDDWTKYILCKRIVIGSVDFEFEAHLIVSLFGGFKPSGDLK